MKVKYFVVVVLYFFFVRMWIRECGISFKAAIFSNPFERIWYRS